MNYHRPQKSEKNKSSPASCVSASISLKALKNENQKLRRQVLHFQQQMMRGPLESGETYQVLIEKSPNMIFINQGGRVVYANPKCEEVMGYKRKEFYSSKFNFLSLMHPEELSMVRRNFLMHQRGKEVAPYEYRMIAKGGKVIHGILTSKLIRYRGAPAILGIVTDVTERKRAEEGIEKLLSLERATLESTADGILVVDGRTGKVADFNERFAQLWNIPDRILRSRDDKKLLQYVLPQLKDPPRFLSKVAKLYRHPRKDSFDTLEFKDGRIFERYSHPQLVDGKPVGRVWSFRDVTERKRAEQELKDSEAKFKVLFNDVREGIVLADIKAKKFSMCNKTLADMLGYTKEEMVRLSVHDIHPKKDLPFVIETFERQARGEFKIAEGLPVKRKDGSIFYADINSSRIILNKKKYLLGSFRDITERKQAEEALRQSEADFRTAQRIAHVGSWSWDVVNDVVTWSQELYRIAGVDPARGVLTYADISKLYTPESWQRLNRAVKKALAAGIPYKLELEMVRPNGEHRWTLVMGEANRNVAGRFLGLFGVVHDITERKNAEAALRLARFSIDHASDCVYWIDAQARMLYVNDATCRTLGYKKKELLKMTIYDVNPYFPASVWPSHWKELKKKGSLTFESTQRTRAGKMIPVEINANFMEFEGEEYNCVFTRDITERKQAEDSLREHQRQLLQVIDAVPHMIFAKDRQGRFLLANRAVGTMYGKEPRELIGKKSYDIHPVPEEARKFVEADRQVLATGKLALGANEIFTDLTGGKHILQTIKIPFKMIGMEEMCVLGVSVDVTEQRKVEEFRNDIVRTVSHELRTPLSIEKEGISLLLDGVVGSVTGEQREILETVMRNIDRLARMITNLLDISVIETGKIKLSQKMTNLAGLVNDVAVEFKKRAGEKGIDLSVKLPGSAVQVFVDPDKITQVLGNLVDNAIKFTSGGGGVEISLNVLKDDVECEVRDNGVGIAPENVVKVFEKFEQFPRISGPGEKGFGLGLSIAKGLIELHEGRIWIKSELGRGTRATFSLPLHQTKED
ncbi:MAG: hypothetical protein A2351_06140 [Omnitrophica bacterium RIFOXYB12_FULL_50_7]|nr:MAG: hypothetical protein A2351_06140 [Omnitrophica bacterium RIFOXYB12_FULL_50_7]